MAIYILWIRFMMTTCFSKTGQDPNTSNCIPKTSNTLNPPEGKSCKSWWSGAGFGLGTGIVDKLENAFGKTPFGGINEDMFVAAKLMTLGGQLNTGEKGVGNKEGNLWQWGEEKTAGLFINIANVVNSATNSAVRFALPVVQGIAMMLIFILLIIFILFGRYNIAQMAGLAILLFGISFLTSIWNIIGWIDNVMLLVIHGGAVGTSREGYGYIFIGASRLGFSDIFSLWIFIFLLATVYSQVRRDWS